MSRSHSINLSIDTLIVIKQITPFLFSVSPKAVKESNDKKVRYAESQKREIEWKYGDLGDSLLENVKVRVRFCYFAKCDFVDFNGTKGVLEDLRADTKYNYTLQVYDTKYLKSGKIAEAKEFRTDEQGIISIAQCQIFFFAHVKLILGWILDLGSKGLK